MLDRRSVIGGAAALGVGLPALAQARDVRQASRSHALPDRALYQRDQEAYWKAIRQQFLIPSDVVFMNPGTAGSSPRSVIDAVMAGFAETEKMTMAGSEEYPVWGYSNPWNEFRQPLADLLGVGLDQLALQRNASEANNTIASGFKLSAGDEVIISNEEHGSLVQPWAMRSKRDGVVVKQFELPRPAKTKDEILNRINDTITSRTRMIFVSHITSTSGTVLPVREIATLARSKGIVCAIDGAQVPGMMRVNVEDIGCDIYTGSLHKWLNAPKGTGFLYIREAMLDRVWVGITTGGWDDPAVKADRFMRFGTSSVPILWGVRSAIQFANAIGMDRIERRQRELADYVHDQMVARGAESWTSPDPTLRCAMATVNVAPIKRMELQDWLWTKHKVRIRGHEPSQLRLCTPYYLMKADIDRFLALYDAFRVEKRLS